MSASPTGIRCVIPAPRTPSIVKRTSTSSGRFGSPLLDVPEVASGSSEVSVLSSEPHAANTTPAAPTARPPARKERRDRAGTEVEPILELVSAGIALRVNGEPVSVPDDAGSLLDALRDHLGLRSAKDGCSPQGQCGCCTVWVDGAPRVACVTPVSRVAGREVTTLEGLPESERD